MWHEVTFGRELFEQLAEMDERIADAVAAGGCERCGGPLHRSDYQRKPRGGSIATAGEAFTKRASLCCGREGCRKRSLPPSLRFLGGRVYLERRSPRCRRCSPGPRAPPARSPASRRARYAAGRPGGRTISRDGQSGRSCGRYSRRHHPTSASCRGPCSSGSPPISAMCLWQIRCWSSRRGGSRR
jgi:hypothetical protein